MSEPSRIQTKSLLGIIGAATMLCLCGASVLAENKAAEETAAAAKKFLASLDEGQRGKVQFDFKDAAQRKRWSISDRMVPRAGLRMGDLTKPSARRIAVLAAVLSPQGYEKVVGIVEGDEMLKKTQGNDMFGHDEYYVSFLGEPSGTEPWMIQFGGHHLGLNITLAGEHGTLSQPHRLAAVHLRVGRQNHPAPWPRNGQGVCPAQFTRRNQRKQAILGFQMHDLVVGPWAGWADDPARGRQRLGPDREAA